MWCSTRWFAEKVLALATAILGWTAGAAAQTQAERPPAHATTSIAALAPSGEHPLLPGGRLQGQATLRYWGLRVYQARLWTLPDFQPDNATQQPLVLELKYLIDLQGQAIAERSLQEMQRAGPIAPEQASRWLSILRSLLPDVKAGDRLVGRLEPGRGLRLWHNERPLGPVADAQFAALFFGIWLAPSTSEPAMRLALLGQTPR